MDRAHPGRVGKGRLRERRPQLDPVAAVLAERWGFEPMEELKGGFCSRVYADRSRVLKVPFQGEEMDSGWRAAVAMSDKLGTTVYEHDPETGALLMARLLPGRSLAEVSSDDEEAFPVLIERMMAMRGIAFEGALRLEEYYSCADPLFDDLVATMKGSVFLHGDLHHSNVLDGGQERGWMVIDPKGLIGDPAYEPVAVLRNPVSQSGDRLADPNRIRQRLVRLCGALDVDAWRVIAWCIVDLRSEADERPTDHAWSLLLGALEGMLSEFRR